RRTSRTSRPPFPRRRTGGSSANGAQSDSRAGKAVVGAGWPGSDRVRAADSVDRCRRRTGLSIHPHEDGRGVSIVAIGSPGPVGTVAADGLLTEVAGRLMDISHLACVGLA